MYCENFLLCQRWDSNRWPLAPKSDTLTTRLCRRKEGASQSWLIVPLLWLFLWKWLPESSKVTSDLISEISGLYNSCTSAFLAPICFLEPFKRKKGRKKAKLTCRSACSFLTADKNARLPSVCPAFALLPRPSLISIAVLVQRRQRRRRWSARGMVYKAHFLREICKEINVMN